MRNNSTEQLHLWVCFHFLLLTPVVFPFPACSSLPFLAFDVFSASNLALSFHISWMFQRNLSNLFPGSDSENIHMCVPSILLRHQSSWQLNNTAFRLNQMFWWKLNVFAFNNDQIRRLLINSKMMHNLASKVFGQLSTPCKNWSSQWPNICHKLSQDNGVQVHEYKSRYQDYSKFLPLSSCSIRFPRSSVVRFIWVAAMLPFEDMKKLGQRKRDALRCTRYVMVRVLTCASIWEFTWFTLTHDLWRSMASPESREHKRTTEVGCGYQGMLEIRKNHPRSLNSLGRFLKC